MIPPIFFDEAPEIAEQIANVLEAAREKGIVHRDLRPSNVKITPGCAVKVLDSGWPSSRQMHRLPRRRRRLPWMPDGTTVTYSHLGARSDVCAGRARPATRVREVTMVLNWFTELRRLARPP